MKDKFEQMKIIRGKHGEYGEGNHVQIIDGVVPMEQKTEQKKNLFS